MVDPTKVIDDVKERRSGFQKVISFIPGYHGYQERETIRESDKLIREELFRHLRNGVRNLDQAFIIAVEKGLPISNQLDRTKIRTDRLAEKVRHAEYGYAGLFDPVKIREEELTRMTNFDASLLESVLDIEKSTESLKKVDASGTSGESSLTALNNVLDDFETSFSERKQVLMGLGK